MGPRAVNPGAMNPGAMNLGAMGLAERLHCPDCQSGLAVAAVDALRCSGCQRLVGCVGGIADFHDGRSLAGADGYRGLPREDGLLATGLAGRIKATAGGRWPAGLGDTIELGCGLGQITQAIRDEASVRSLLVIDSDITMLRACRTRLASRDGGGPRTVCFAALGGEQDIIRDAVADTVIGSCLLAAVSDVRRVLSMVHRVLRPGGRAAFVVPNRRFHGAACLAMAEALVQHHSRHGSWPDGCSPIMNLLGQLRRRLARDDSASPLGQPAPAEADALFDSDALLAMGEQIGFSGVEMVPLDPDPMGIATLAQMGLEAGATEAFVHGLAPLAGTVGAPFLGLLSERDRSAFNLLWLTKADGPAVRVYTGSPAVPRVVYPSPDAALGGAPPRWSLELTARASGDGIVVTVGGWCLCNVDALAVRITLDGSQRSVAVWRPRPDVHEALNQARIYHSVNALCSGVEEALRFPELRPTEAGCGVAIDIVLAGGLTVKVPVPGMLRLNQPLVIAH